jgi:hypothetical protein
MQPVAGVCKSKRWYSCMQHMLVGLRVCLVGSEQLPRMLELQTRSLQGAGQQH